MEERDHATTQNRFYPDMSNVNKNITVEAKLIRPPSTSVERNILYTLPVIYIQYSMVTSQVHHSIQIINAVFLNEVGMKLRNFRPFDNQSDIFKWDEDT